MVLRTRSLGTYPWSNAEWRGSWSALGEGKLLLPFIVLTARPGPGHQGAQADGKPQVWKASIPGPASALLLTLHVSLGLLKASVGLSLKWELHLTNDF